MSEAHRKKKQPEQVHRTLLECTAKFAAEVGLARVTIEAVAKAAGITKGGLLHHFPSKQALIEAMVIDMLEQVDQMIEDSMAKDSIVKGRFTRAYVAMSLHEDNFNPLDPWSFISVSLISDKSSVNQFFDWLENRLEMHKETDSDPMFELIRYAADGAWLHLVAKMDAGSIEKARDVQQRLIAMSLSV